jgi:hypothetical protein
MPTGLLAHVTNQTRGALCVGNLGSRGSFTSLVDMRMEALEGGRCKVGVYQVVFLAMAVEVKPFLRSSTVPCRLNCDAIALAFDYGDERTRCSAKLQYVCI